MKKQLPLKDRVLFTVPKRKGHAIPWREAHETSGEERTVDKSLHCLYLRRNWFSMVSRVV